MAKARVAVLISGRGSNMAALIYAAKHPECPFEIVLVAANDPQAAGLKLAAAEGIPIFAQSHKGTKREEFDAIITARLKQAATEFVALAGYMRLLSHAFVNEWRSTLDPAFWLFGSLLALVPGSFAIYNWWYYHKSRLQKRLEQYLEQAEKRLRKDARIALRRIIEPRAPFKPLKTPVFVRPTLVKAMRKLK